MNVSTLKTNAVPAPAPKPPSRMSLANVVSGPIEMPLRILAYGMEGIGKSTYAAGAPKPIFLGCDKGTGRLHITRMPEPKTWEDVIEGVALLEKEAHDYQTLVIDTANSLEPLCWHRVTGGMCSIEDYAKGYGRGYNAALDHWREFVSGLERLWEKRRMNVILLAHTQVKGFNNPLGANFDRYEVSMNAKAAGMLKQWVDFVLFMREETTAKPDDQKNIKGRSSGARFIHTKWSAAYDAKARGWMPDQVPLSWAEFYAAANEAPVRRAEFMTQIEAGIAELANPEIEKKTREFLADPRIDVAEIANAIAAKVQEKREQQVKEGESK